MTWNLVRNIKVLVAFTHALLPLGVAYTITSDPQQAASLPQAVLFLMQGFALVSIAIFTSELLLLRRYPSELAPMLAILVTPPLLIFAHWRIFSAPPRLLLVEMGTFYLASFALVYAVLLFHRFVNQKLVSGWAWAPVSLTIVLLFVPATTGLWVFGRTLAVSGFFDGLSAPSSLVVAVVVAAANEVRLVLKYYPGPSAPSDKQT